MQAMDIEKLMEYYLRYGFSIPNASDFLKKPQAGSDQGPGLAQVQASLPGLGSDLSGIQQPNGGVPSRAAAPPAEYGLG